MARPGRKPERRVGVKDRRSGKDRRVKQIGEKFVDPYTPRSLRRHGFEVTEKEAREHGLPTTYPYPGWQGPGKVRVYERRIKKRRTKRRRSTDTDRRVGPKDRRSGKDRRVKQIGKKIANPRLGKGIKHDDIEVTREQATKFNLPTVHPFGARPQGKLRMEDRRYINRRRTKGRRSTDKK